MTIITTKFSIGDKVLYKDKTCVVDYIVIMQSEAHYSIKYNVKETDSNTFIVPTYTDIHECELKECKSYILQTDRGELVPLKRLEDYKYLEDILNARGVKFTISELNKVDLP